MTKLSVNVNKIALVRNSRGGDHPSVTWAARTAIEAGAHGITVHPRPDGRHILPRDVHDLAEIARAAGVEFNVEGNPTPEYMRLACETRPDQATLVPDDRGQLTSDHGWDLADAGEQLKPLIVELKSHGIRVSLFMDPVEAPMRLARDVGADRIELYTEEYARAHAAGNARESLREYADAAAAAEKAGLGVNAGHDLNLDNLTDFCRAVPGVLEVSIGHALITDALKIGLGSAVEAYLKALADAGG